MGLTFTQELPGLARTQIIAGIYPGARQAVEVVYNCGLSVEFLGFALMEVGLAEV